MQIVVTVAGSSRNGTIWAFDKSEVAVGEAIIALEAAGVVNNKFASNGNANIDIYAPNVEGVPSSVSNCAPEIPPPNNKFFNLNPVKLPVIYITFLASIM